MRLATVLVLGMFILVAAIGHALVSKTCSEPIQTIQKPIQTGYVLGEVWKKEPNGIAHLKCNGFKVECYESFVVIHVDKSKEPTWTDDYVLTIPWSKIENLTMLPE